MCESYGVGISIIMFILMFIHTFDCLSCIKYTEYTHRHATSLSCMYLNPIWPIHPWLLFTFFALTFFFIQTFDFNQWRDIELVHPSPRNAAPLKWIHFQMLFSIKTDTILTVLFFKYSLSAFKMYGKWNANKIWRNSNSHFILADLHIAIIKIQNKSPKNHMMIDRKCEHFFFDSIHHMLMTNQRVWKQ